MPHCMEQNTDLMRPLLRLFTRFRQIYSSCVCQLHRHWSLRTPRIVRSSNILPPPYRHRPVPSRRSNQPSPRSFTKSLAARDYVDANNTRTAPRCKHCLIFSLCNRTDSASVKAIIRDSSSGCRCLHSVNVCGR